MTFPRNVHLGVLILATAWCAGILLAPILQPSLVSSFLYSIYSQVCHQLPGRSFHLAGEALGVCVRCSGIYGGFLVAMAAYPFLIRWHRSLTPPPRVLALFLLPMALDVALRLTGILHGVEATRFLSGILCGLILPFVLLPPLTDAVRQFFSSQGDLSHARETR